MIAPLLPYLAAGLCLVALIGAGLVWRGFLEVAGRQSDRERRAGQEN